MEMLRHILWLGCVRVVMLGVSVWDLIIVDLLCWLFLGICLLVF